jgi:hypothetical protein
MRTGWEIDCFRKNWNRAENVLFEIRLVLILFWIRLVLILLLRVICICYISLHFVTFLNNSTNVLLLQFLTFRNIS